MVSFGNPIFSYKYLLNNNMKQAINDFRQSSNQFCQMSDSVHSTWQDNVGDAFYHDIIDPMKELSSNMATAMEDLSSTLYRIKEEIDRI